MLDDELYAQRLQKLILLYLFSGCVAKLSLHSSVKAPVHETACRQNIDKSTFLIFVYVYLHKYLLSLIYCKLQDLCRGLRSHHHSCRLMDCLGPLYTLYISRLLDAKVHFFQYFNATLVCLYVMCCIWCNTLEEFQFCLAGLV